MATINATLPMNSATLVHKRSVGISSSYVLGLPKMANKGRVTCSIEGKQDSTKEKAASKEVINSASLLATAVCGATMSSPVAMALVDERMSTEGTGLPFGLSNNLLGWILFGVFGLIWALYTVYTSTLEEDEDSGLSL